MLDSWNNQPKTSISVKTAKKIPTHTTTKKVLEKDENENSCEKVATNGISEHLLGNSEEVQTQVFEEIQLETRHVDEEQPKTHRELPEIDIGGDDKAKKFEDFELHRKLMEEQVDRIRDMLKFS
jgi:hypothetical protein